MGDASKLTADLFRAIAEYTYDWETWVDQDGTTRWVNGAVARITGYDADECLARADYPLWLAHEPDRAILARVLADAQAGGSGNDVEFRVRTRSGGLRWVAISWQLLREGARSLGYRTSIRDIEERKQMEAELHRVRQRAEALAEARSELLANVSHELRSPAHCIAGFAELLLQGPQLEPKQRHYLAIIVEQCRSMQRQVEDLLSLAALEAGGVELSYEAIDLAVFVQALIETSQSSSPRVSVRGELRCEPERVQVDALRLQQVLRNLIDNALKFTEQGSVTLSAFRGGDAATPLLCFEVSDTGSGMDPAQVDTLLLPFRQGDASSRKRHGGVGLGLAIVRRLVSAMGGELAIQTAPGQGTRVTVSLPWIQAGTGATEAPAPQQEPMRSGTALVVDDSAVARELLSGLLESCGFSSVAAGSGDEAEALLAQHAFDVLFIDYQMPGSDGAETALRLRRALSGQAAADHVPIFIVTANVFAHEQLREARAVVDGVLVKPLTRAALQRVLRQLPVDAPAERGTENLVREEVVRDLEATLHKTGPNMLQYLLPRVRTDYDRTFAQATHALDARDWRALARASHSLAGHVSLVGAAYAAALFNELELKAEAPTPDSDEASALLSRADAAFRAAHALLEARAS